MSQLVDIVDPTRSTVERVGKVELPESIFSAKVNVPLMHQVVVAQLAAARQGTHSTKTRGEVSGGGRKPYRQKGTGRARQGSTRSPQFAGGGIAHGPTPRNYAQRTPKKMIRGALLSALSARADEANVRVVTGFVVDDYPGTNMAVRSLRRLTDAPKILAIVSRADEVSWRSLKNIPWAHRLDPGQLNTYDVLCSDEVIFTEEAFHIFVDQTLASLERDHHARGAGNTSPLERSVAYADNILDVGKVTETVHGEPPAKALDGPLEKVHDVVAAGAQRLVHLDDIRAAFMNERKVRVYHQQADDIDATAFETNDVDVINVERHINFVLTSWPSNLTAVNALSTILDKLHSDSSPKTAVMYASTKRERRTFEGPGIDEKWLGAHADTLQSLRLELDHETLVWRVPISPQERSARFIAYETTLDVSHWLDLLRATADVTVADLVRTGFNDGDTLAPLHVATA